MAASRRVVIGADTHLDTIHLAVITGSGKLLADAEFATSPAGYDDAVRWARSFGMITIAGVEGTSSYSAGLTRVLQAAQIEVAEVSRLDRAARRRRGKSDPLDAYAAARAALAGDGVAVPKDAHTGAVRALLSARRSAVKARTAATNQIHALLVTAPTELRDRYRRYSTTALVTALARCRPATHSDPITVAVLTAAKALAQRAEFLEHQKQDLTATQRGLLRRPVRGGPCPGTLGQNHPPPTLPRRRPSSQQCPVPHRLVRMSAQPQTRDYVQRQVAKGRTKKEILRLLKRAIAREIFRVLTRPAQVDDYGDLRPARQAKNITLAAAATHFGVPLITISRLERGHQRNDTLANNYRQWLAA